MEPTSSRLKEEVGSSRGTLTPQAVTDAILVFSTRMVTARDYSLVRVLSEDEAEGIGFCYAGNVGGKVVTTAVRELLAPVLVGEDPYRVEGLWQEMYQEALRFATHLASTVVSRTSEDRYPTLEEIIPMT
jgi:L-alanine-DL-glutamate epimerase-like enolase superfamily enzyme